MENDKSATTILKEFAKRTDRNFEFTEKPYPSVAMHKVTYHRRMLFIPNNINENSYFVCFGDSKELGPKALFSGVFMHVDLPVSTIMTVRKKDVLDKLNPFSKKKYCKTGIPGFDSQVRITADDPAAVKRVFQDRKMQKLVKDAIKLDAGIIVGINDVNIDFVPILKEKSHLGVYIQQEWILDCKMIEKLFDLMESFQITSNQ